MNRRLSVGITAGVVVVIGAALIIGFSGSHSASGSCKAGTTSMAFDMTIQNSTIVPQTVVGKLCDTLKITNRDNGAREIAFGPHSKHTAYDGIAERVLNKNQSLTVTFNKTGKFSFHDHLHDEVVGYFEVRD